MERELLALPAYHGGLGIHDPTKSDNSQFSASSGVSEPLASLIPQQNSDYPVQTQVEAKAAIRSSNRKAVSEEADIIKPKLPKP